MRQDCLAVQAVYINQDWRVIEQYAMNKSDEFDALNRANEGQQGLVKFRIYLSLAD